MPKFSHLHVHTQYSLLDGAAAIKSLINKAAIDEMPAVAITDHGNMYGVFEFVNEAQKANIKPIVGCEFYLTEDRHKKQFTAQQRDKRYHQLLLAKNQTGYHNLSKLCSLGFIEGLYSKYPRIDKELLLQYHEGLIATTCCLGAEVPQAIMYKSEAEAEDLFKWWLNLFGDDYYIELQNHHLEEQKKVNAILLKFATKYKVKVIASNDSHYIEKEDSLAQDILLCVNTGEVRSKPIGDGREYRFGFPNDQFYFKKQSEMIELFQDIPEAIDNTNEIVDKIEPPKIKRDILLPNFPLPPSFNNEDEYLYALTYEGARKRYKELTSEVTERIEHELKVIRNMGFAGYFLVVGDFISAARNLKVIVGPGRGSAAGSVVAYCTGITNIDPIKYNLLFERFLNPERVNMPDIDTDFDDDGRQRVIDYVVEKYGRTQVAQIITFGTMAAKSSIKDVARVLELSINEANDLTKKIPTRQDESTGTTLSQMYQKVPELQAVLKSNTLRSEVLKLAAQLEGSIRNTGVHAAGVIIAPDDITNYIPVSVSKDSDLLLTQFEGTLIENAGMLKMDFLGLKTLSILRDAIENIRIRHGIEIEIDNIPLDDKKTFELYQRGNTIGTFQFESDGMRKHLRDLKPNAIEDLIAMNALYRPGPMAYIESYIKRKHGHEAIEYPHPLLKPILENTCGIMIYQEQIMQAAQIIAGYSLGGADTLRRAMGKKDKVKMAKERDTFCKGAKDLHQIDEKVANEIFDVMEKFAEYGFNRSHSAAYSVLAYHTAYLKANYPAEYMASVLSRNTDLETLTSFLDESKRMHLNVLGPDINESQRVFSVNAKGQIRFGLQAIKGLGEAAINALIEEREKAGIYKSLSDVVKRVKSRNLNRRSIEALVYAGALDSFEGTHRAQYFALAPNESVTMIEKVMKFGNALSTSNSLQNSLFGDLPPENMDINIQYPNTEPWSIFEQLHHEKEVTGIYISGHPLDNYKTEMHRFCNCTLVNLEHTPKHNLSFAGIIVNVNHLMTKNQKPFGVIELEDRTGTKTFKLFGEKYLRFKHFFEVNTMLYIEGRYEQRWNSEDYEFTFTDILLLQDLREKKCNSVRLRTDIESIDDLFISQLAQIVRRYPGKYALELEVKDSMNNYVLLSAPHFTISLSDEFLAECNSSNMFELLLN